MCNGNDLFFRKSKRNKFAVSYQPCTDQPCLLPTLCGIYLKNQLYFRNPSVWDLFPSAKPVTFLRRRGWEADAADPAQCLAATIFMPFVHVCGGIWMHLILFVSWHDCKGCSMMTPPITLGDKKCLQGSLTSRHRCWNAKWQRSTDGFSHSLGFD